MIPAEKRAPNLVRNAKHDYGASVVVVEIDPFGHLASSDRQKDSASSIVAGLQALESAFRSRGGLIGTTHPPIVLERRTRLDGVWRLDKDELVLEDLVQNSLRSELACQR